MGLQAPPTHPSIAPVSLCSWKPGGHCTQREWAHWWGDGGGLNTTQQMTPVCTVVGNTGVGTAALVASTLRTHNHSPSTLPTTPLAMLGFATALACSQHRPLYLYVLLKSDRRTASTDPHVPHISSFHTTAVCLAAEPPAQQPPHVGAAYLLFLASMVSSWLSPGPRMLNATQPTTGPNSRKKMPRRPSATSATC
jgi:hypothetical protein